MEGHTDAFAVALDIMTSQSAGVNGNSRPGSKGSTITPRTSLRATPTRAESDLFFDASESPVEMAQTDGPSPERLKLQRSQPSTISSIVSVPPPGAFLTGKQEHYLKRELIAAQTEWEVHELSHRGGLGRSVQGSG